MRFSSPPNPKEYQTLVWKIVRQIPAGKVATYGQIARLIPPPMGMDGKDYLVWSPRWVGGAMASCPEDVPWQRVINAQGKISLKKGEGFSIQRELLELEGVQFDEKERVNLKIFGWQGPD